MRVRLVNMCIAVCLLLLMIPGCTNQQPILVGLSMEMTGRRSDLGVEARDGVMLAVDQINAAGGINGRPIQLLIRDEKGDPEMARQMDAELIEAGVVAILGHTTSEQTAAVLDEINEAEVVLLSPTAASSDFDHQGDYFFRVMSSNYAWGRVTAKYIYQSRGLHRIVGIYDIGNRSYTETFWNVVSEEFEALGGDASQSFVYISGETDLQALMETVSEVETDGLVMVSSPVDTALMVQYARQFGIECPIFSSPWAETSELLNKGGAAVEGLEMVSAYNFSDSSPNAQAFRSDFITRYNRAPGFPAAYAFEAMLVLAEALRITGGKAEGLPEALLSIEDFEGVQGSISIDPYGDVTRDIYITTIKDRQFVTTAIISPEE